MNTTLPPQFEQFDQKLIAAQRVDDSLRQKYEREVQAMFEKNLTGWNKALFAVVGVITVVLAVVFTVATVKSTHLPWEARSGFVLGALFAGAWTALMVRVLRRGRMNLRIDERAQAGLSWAFVVLMVTLFMVLAAKNPDSIRGVGMVVNGLVFLIGAALFMIQAGINSSRMKIEERLIEMQLRIAELTEELKKRP
jgi:hypothetical protein